MTATLPAIPLPGPPKPTKPATSAASAVRCLGREAELARLGELYRECRQGGERLAIVEGPTGIGKTRLLEAF
ncbi:MAG: AAA family ATPase, partial [Myxococcota bacterium]